MKITSKDKPTTPFGLLLIGEPKTGKTCLAAGFPAPGFLDADNNLASAVAKHPTKELRYAAIDTDDEGRPVAPSDRWLRLLKAGDEMIASPDVQTIVLDSMTRITTYLTDYIIARGGASGTKDLIVGGEKVMTQQMWYPFKMLFERFIMKLRACGKTIIAISHVKVDKDEVSGQLTYKPAIPGQTADSFGGMFTDVWACMTQACAVSPKYPQGVRYYVRTMPTARLSLGNSLSLAPEIEYEELMQTVYKTIK